MFATNILYKILEILFLPVKFMPRRLEMGLGYLLGLFIYYVLRRRRSVVRKNLLLAFEQELARGDMNMKDINRIEIDNYIHIGRFLLEILHIPFDAKRFSEKNVNVYGLGNIEKAHKKKKGVFILTAHIGYWEIMSITGSLLNKNIYVLTKYLRIKFLDNIWVKSRKSYGVKLIKETNSAKDVLKAVKENNIVGYVLDQFTVTGLAVKTKFFNKTAWTSKSLALFAMKTGAAVVPAYTYRNPDGTFDFHIYPELDFVKEETKEKTIQTNTQIYTNTIEEFIRQEPEQWLWMHKRWKSVDDEPELKDFYSK